MKININDLNYDKYIESLNPKKQELIKNHKDDIESRAKKAVLEQYNLEMEIKTILAYKDSIQVVMSWKEDDNLVLNYVLRCDFENMLILDEMKDLMYFERNIINYLIFRIHKVNLEQYIDNNISTIYEPTQSFYKSNIYVSALGDFSNLYEAFMNNHHISEDNLLLEFYKDISEEQETINVGISKYDDVENIEENNFEVIVNELKPTFDVGYFNYYVIFNSNQVELPAITFEKTISRKVVE